MLHPLLTLQRARSPDMSCSEEARVKLEVMLTTCLGHRQQCLEQSRTLFIACLLMLHPVLLEDHLLWGPHLIQVAREKMLVWG